MADSKLNAALQQLLTRVVPINRGGTGANNAELARQNINYLGEEPIKSTTNDTPAKWAALGTGIAYYHTSGLLNNQPTANGIVYNLVAGKLVFQVFNSINGRSPTWCRSGNSSGWYPNSQNWVKALDEINTPDRVTAYNLRDLTVALGSSWHYQKYASGLVDMAVQVKITPSAANTATFLDVTLPFAIKNYCAATTVNGLPMTTTCNIGAYGIDAVNDTITKLRVGIYASNTTGRTITIMIMGVLA